MVETVTAARPYAKAVFELARNSGNYEAWSQRLSLLKAVVADPAVSVALDDPSNTSADRASLVEKIVGDKLDAEGVNMVRLLAENNRLSLLGEVGEIYEHLRADEEGTLEATVITAMALDDNYRNKIAEALQRRFDKKVNIIEEIDDSLIGGAIIRAGDIVIDGSVKGRLSQLGSSLSAR